jgi:Spy/CpxP family protein refolding chaperone
MKRIRVFALVGALLAFAAPSAYAQGGGGQGGRGRQMQMLMEGIELTDAQKASVDSIAQVYRAQMPAFTPGQPMDSTARAKRMEVMQKQYDAIRGVLTADQQKVYDKNLEEMRSRMHRPRP